MVSDIMYVLIMSLSSTLLPPQLKASVLNQVSLIGSGRYIIVIREVVWVE